MTRVRVVTVTLIGLTGLAVALGSVTAQRVPPASWLLWSVAVLIGTTIAAFAVLVNWKAPDNSCAAVLALSGCWISVSQTADLWEAGVPIGSAPPNPWVVALTQGAWSILFLPLAWLLLIFPTGRLLSPRWRLVGIGLPMVIVVFDLADAIAPGPYAEPFPESPKVLGTSGVAEYVTRVCLAIFLALLVASVVSVVLRYRRADPEG